jgi:integrase
MSPKRRQKGTGSLFQRADGTWVGVVDLPTTDGTRRQKRVSSKNRNEAMRKLRELKDALDAGLDPSAGKVQVGVYLDEWLTKVHKYNVKPSTYPGHERTIRLYVKPHIGGIRLNKLTPVDVRNMVEELRVKSPTSAAKAHQMLGYALDQAVKDGFIGRNVVRAVDKPRYLVDIHPAFTPAEALHIIRTAEKGDEMWAGRWAAGFMTGLRESELLGLEWDRVDLDDNLLDVSWQLQQLNKTHGCGPPIDKKYPCGKVRVSFCPQAHWNFNPDFEYRPCERNSVWTRPKSLRSNRELPIIPPLRIILERLSTSTRPNPHNLVFRHEDGSPILQRQDQAAWTALLKEAGMEHRRQHTLRRTAATLLRAAQVDEQTRMELFGHAQADVQRLYAQSELELRREAMDKLSGFFPLEGK